MTLYEVILLVEIVKLIYNSCTDNECENAICHVTATEKTIETRYKIRYKIRFKKLFSLNKYFCCDNLNLI